MWRERPPDLKPRLERALARGPTLARRLKAAQTRGTFGYQGGFDRFNDPSAGSPRYTEQGRAFPHCLLAPACLSGASTLADGTLSGWD